MHGCSAPRSSRHDGGDRSPDLAGTVGAAGDYINAELLGNVRTGMIGSQVAKLFLRESNYPAAAALSFIFMAIITAGVLIYARLLGTQELTA